MWASFVAILKKEFIHLRRDRATLAMALALPVFQLLLFGFIDQTVHDLPTVVVDQDRSSHSRELQAQLKASGTFKIIKVTPDPKEAREDISAGRARVGVIIPPDFHGRRSRNLPAQFLVLLDGSDGNVSQQALGSINGLIATANLNAVGAAGRFTPPLSAQPVLLFNPSGRTANFIIPGLIAILVQIVALVLAAVAIVRERERGTLEQLLVTPLDPLGLMLGKLAPYLLIGLAEVALVLALMRFGFQVPIRGSVPFLFLMATVYLFALLAMGLFISTRATSQLEAQQMAQMLLLPSIFLSGYIFPAEGLPAPLYYIGRLFPATHMIAILRGVVLRDAGPSQLVGHVAALAAMSIVLVLVSARRIRQMTQ